MFDFRYHALSLVAVFLALGIGILLGVTIGDSLVSEAEKSVRSSLRSDLSEARDEARSLRAERERLDRFIERAVPPLVDGRLTGARVAIVALGRLPDEVEAPVRDAIEAADGKIDSTSIFETPVDERAIADAVGGRFARLGAGEELLRALGERVGRSIARGGTSARRLETRFQDRFEGDWRGADAVVVYRVPPENRSDASAIFVDGLLEGLGSRNTSVVGVERSRRDDSQVSFYSDHGLSSVDSIDLAAGRAALVFALAGARGSFGLGPEADEPLPKAE